MSSLYDNGLNNIRRNGIERQKGQEFGGRLTLSLRTQYVNVRRAGTMRVMGETKTSEKLYGIKAKVNFVFDNATYFQLLFDFYAKYI